MIGYSQNLYEVDKADLLLAFIIVSISFYYSYIFIIAIIYSTDEEIESKLLSDLPKDTQIVAEPILGSELSLCT